MSTGASTAQLCAQLIECTLSLQYLQHSFARVQGLAAPAGSYPTVLTNLDDLPLFQWTGMVLDLNVHVFSDLSDCLICFEDILLMYGLAPDPHFLRFIPVKHFGEVREWYSLFLSSFLPNAPSYEQLKVAIMERFKPITCQS
ncbi:hypothetical protein A0J61_05573 [Choanephora cucurbitarum]|uniref:Uncharacterized protein n=1 Tax=Choanephora cucurbitarum TaxID=101091 RepID=A0A1C7NCA6_9FUNG|nr:hypothetical protein A0J61_05573 [Choanephora cucurbitarum]